MPANGRWDLIRHLRVKVGDALHIVAATTLSEISPRLSGVISSFWLSILAWALGIASCVAWSWKMMWVDVIMKPVTSRLPLKVICWRPKKIMRFPVHETIPISSVASVEINKKCVGRVQTRDGFWDNIFLKYQWLVFVAWRSFADLLEGSICFLWRT